MIQDQKRYLEIARRFAHQPPPPTFEFAECPADYRHELEMAKQYDETDAAAKLEYLDGNDVSPSLELLYAYANV